MSERRTGGFRRFLVCAGKALCYLFLFIGWQSLVSSAYLYRAVAEMEMGGLPGGYRLGLLVSLGGTAVFGIILVAAMLLVIRLRKIGVKRFLSLDDRTGPGLTRAAAVTAALGLVGGLLLLAYVGWMGMYSASCCLYGLESVLYGTTMDMDLLYEEALAYTPEIGAISGILTLLSVALTVKLREKQITREIWLRPVSGRLLGWCAALSFCLYWLVTLVLSALPEAWMADYIEMSSGLDDSSFMAILATGVIAPITEEVIFRGLIYTRLQRGLHPTVAVVVSALIFGYCHGEAVWFCYAFILGSIFALLTRDTRSILPALVMHTVFNATNEVLVLLGEWTPGVVLSLVLLAVGLAGSVLCGLKVRKLAVKERERAFVPPVPAAPADAEEKVPAAPVSTARPAGAAWDSDSGPGHKFPPHML